MTDATRSEIDAAIAACHQTCKRCGRSMHRNNFVGALWWKRCNACEYPYIAVLVDSTRIAPTDPEERRQWLERVAAALRQQNMFFALWPEAALNGARNHVRGYWPNGADLTKDESVRI